MSELEISTDDSGIVLESVEKFSEVESETD